MPLSRSLLTEFSRTLLPRSWAPVTEPAQGGQTPMLEPTPRRDVLSVEPPRRRHPKPTSNHPSAKEHAEALLAWIRRNVDLSSGPIFHSAVLEYYTEMLLERGWRELKWNPVALQFRLITTGRRKVYAWVQTTTGTPHRLRVYPIPPAACSSDITAVTSSLRSSLRRTEPKLRSVA